jgi:hypothetical protein
MVMSNYSASDQFVVWLESLSGMLTKIKTEYGGIIALTEHPNWDENRTIHVRRLVHALRIHLDSIDEELADYVDEKYG